MSKMPITLDKFTSLVTALLEEKFNDRSEAEKAVSEFSDSIKSTYDGLENRFDREVTADVIKDTANGLAMNIFDFS